MVLIRVVLADDHPLVREALELFLQRFEDVSVMAAVVDGKQAVTACEQHQPHLALLDYRMDGSNGDYAAEEIKRRFPEVLVTGMSLDVHAAEQMRKAGADFFCDKTEILTQLLLILGAVRQQLAAAE